MKCTLTSDTYLSAFGTVVRFFIIVHLHVFLHVIFRIRLVGGDTKKIETNYKLSNIEKKGYLTAVSPCGRLDTQPSSQWNADP